MVHELGFTECPKSYVFRGTKEYPAQKVGSATSTPAAVVTPHPACTGDHNFAPRSFANPGLSPRSTNPPSASVAGSRLTGYHEQRARGNADGWSGINGYVFIKFEPTSHPVMLRKRPGAHAITHASHLQQSAQQAQQQAQANAREPAVGRFLLPVSECRSKLTRNQS